MQPAQRLLPRSASTPRQSGPDVVACDVVESAGANRALGDLAAWVPPGMPGRVAVRLLGGFDVHVDGASRPMPASRASTMLKIVALHGTVPVEMVAEHLWPDVPAATGRVRLRNVLLRLRGLCGDVVVRHGQVLRLGDGVHVDVAQFEADARVALTAPTDDPAGLVLAKRALAVYRGALLPGDRYEEWVLEAQRRIQSRYLGLLDFVATSAQRRGDLAHAVRLLELAVEEEPWSEDRYLRMAETLLSAGRRGDARAWLQRAATVTAEFGLPLSVRHRQLLAATRRG